MSDRVFSYCVQCSHGFRKEHIVNGICHHAHVIEDLQYMKDHGVEAWVQQQEQTHRCPACGSLMRWFESACQKCGKSK